MENETSKESKRGKRLILFVLIYVFIVLALAFFATRPEFIFNTVLAQNQTSNFKSKKIAEEFDRQRKNAAPGQWVLYRGNPVLVRGEPNSWDDFKVGSPVVIKEGGRYKMWYRGCHFIGSEYTCGIGHAVSEDGVIWKKSPDPVLVIGDAARSKLLDTIALLHVPEKGYMMWYSLSSDRFAGRRYATIHLATSTDGLKWKDTGAVLRGIGEGTTYIEHTVFHDGKIFHLWYVDSPYPGAIKAILHVTSSDGKKWQIAGWTPLDILTVNPGRLWVLSDGHGGFRGFFASPPQEERDKGLFSTLVSADGTDWQQQNEAMNLTGTSLKEGRIADAPSVLLEPGGLWMWFVIRPEDGAEAIGVAYRKGELH